METRHQGVFHSVIEAHLFGRLSNLTLFINFLPQLYLGLCASYAISQKWQVKIDVNRAAAYSVQLTLTPKHLAQEVIRY